MDLKKKRNQRGLSINDLSVLTGVPTRTIEDIEKRGSCNVDTAIKISKGLNMTLDELCDNCPNDINDRYNINACYADSNHDFISVTCIDTVTREFYDILIKMWADPFKLYYSTDKPDNEEEFKGVIFNYLKSKYPERYN